MRLKVLANALTLYLASMGAANAQTKPVKKTTFWLGGPAILQYSPGDDGRISLGLGIGRVLYVPGAKGYGTMAPPPKIRSGLVVEAMSYPKGDCAGLALNLRLGSVEGNAYLAPGAFYGSRPSGNVVGRVGLMFPLGTDISPFLPDLAIGLRF
jgi:hypothetical protein